MRGRVRPPRLRWYAARFRRAGREPVRTGLNRNAHKGEFMARSLLLLALVLCGLATPTMAQNPPIPLPPFLTPKGTPEDQRNCRTDAVKFCKQWAEANDDDGVLTCFQANRAKLTPACQGVLTKYGK